MEMPQLSAGWLYKFKRRHGVKQYIRHGEAGDVDEAAVSEQIKLLQSLVQNYHPADVYNCDETGLFWKSTPDRGLATQQFSGTKQNKSRITAHFCCNADGSDKVPVWIIGKSAWPRAFTAAKVNLASLGCHWRYNGKAWMNTELFIQWLQWFNDRVAPRKVLLIMDNFSAHIAAVSEQLQHLNHLVICWLPPNVTSRYQPLDQGIIKAFKAHYRRHWLQYMIDEFDHNRQPLKTTNVLKALRWTVQSWQAVTVTTISNCWRHSTLVSEVSLPDSSVQDVQQQALELVQELQITQRISNAMAIESFLNPVEEEIIDIEEDLEVAIADEMAIQPDYESEEEVEIIPPIAISNALQSLQVLRHFVEQQEYGYNDIGPHLNELEGRIVQQRRHRGQQRTITAYFS